MEQTQEFKIALAGWLPLGVAFALDVIAEYGKARNMTVIYILFQRMIGDASLSFKRQKRAQSHGEGLRAEAKSAGPMTVNPNVVPVLMETLHHKHQIKNNIQYSLSSLSVNLDMVAATPASVRRRTTRSRLAATPVSRSPVMLEIVSHSVLYAGHVGQPRAQHLVAIRPTPSAKATSAEYYRIYAPVIQTAYSMLGQDPKERRVIVLMDDGLYRNRHHQQALRRILLQDAKAPACCFHPSIQMIPTCFPPKREKPHQDAMLIVQFTLKEAHCIAYASGHSLEYTYQVAADSKEKGDPSMKNADWIQTQNSWLSSGNDGTSLLVRAILQCIAACPRETRRGVVHNIVFCGIIADTNFDINFAKGLRAALKSQQHAPPTSKDDDEDAGSASPLQWATSTPISDSQDLRSLAEHVSVVKLGSLRPDLLPWLGASVWAKHWHGIDPEATNFRWIPQHSD